MTQLADPAVTQDEQRVAPVDRGQMERLRVQLDPKLGSPGRVVTSERVRRRARDPQAAGSPRDADRIGDGHAAHHVERAVQADELPRAPVRHPERDARPERVPRRLRGGPVLRRVRG